MVGRRPGGRARAVRVVSETVDKESGEGLVVHAVVRGVPPDPVLSLSYESLVPAVMVRGPLAGSSREAWCKSAALIALRAALATVSIP